MNRFLARHSRHMGIYRSLYTRQRVFGHRHLALISGSSFPLSLSPSTSLSSLSQATCAHNETQKKGKPGRPFSSVAHNMALEVMKEHSLDRQTKIICTAGPTLQGVEGLREVMLKGMNVLRLNFSHGDHEDKRKVIQDLRYVLNEFRDESMEKSVDFTDGSQEYFCAVAADVKGPKIRTGWFAPGADGEEVTQVLLEEGQSIAVSVDPADKKKGSKNSIYIDYTPLPDSIEPGQRIFLNDGALSLTCESVDTASRIITCIVDNTAILSQRKGVNIPDVKKLDLPALTTQDYKDIAFAVDQQVDIIFASFMRKKEDVMEVRAAIEAAQNPRSPSSSPSASRKQGRRKRHGRSKKIMVISKIESPEGLRNFDEILAASDGIMVARGDLGIEIPAEKVFLAQKMMIAKCNVVGKPVVCATQMLESMIDNPVPTRAECSDVANAVIDGADMVMLSGETANGKHPLNAVTMMAKICWEAEMAVDNSTWSKQLRKSYKYSSFARKNNHMMDNPYAKDDAVVSVDTGVDTVDSMRALAISAVQCSYHTKAAMIVVVSQTGSTCKFVSAAKPECPVLCVTSDEKVATQTLIYRGVQPVYLQDRVMRNSFECVRVAISYAKDMGICKEGDQVVFVESGHISPAMGLVQINASNIDPHYHDKLGF